MRCLVLLAGLALLLAPGPGLTPSTLWTLEGERDADEFGASLATWDFDGDGWTDVAVGAPGDSKGGRDAGAVHLFSGKTRERLVVLHGEAGDRFGQSIALIDADADGFGDLVVGAPGRQEGAGAVRIVPKAHREKRRVHVAEGEHTGNRLGAWVCGAPAVPGSDANGVLVGEPGHDANRREDAGRARLLRLRHLDEARPRIEVVREWTGRTAGARLGEFVGLAGDVDEDLTPDVYVGEPGGAGAEGEPTGALLVASGANGETLWRFTGRGAGDLFGSSAATVLVHGEGVQYNEILVGARGYAEIFGSRKGELRRAIEADAPGHDFGLVVGGQFRMETSYQWGFTVSTACFEAASSDAFHGVRIYSGETLEEVARVPAERSRLGLTFAHVSDGQARDILLVGESRPGRGAVRAIELKASR